MFLPLIPLYYQLLQAYQPVKISPSSPVNQLVNTPSVSPTPSLSPSVLGTSTTRPSLPAASVGGDGQVLSVALFGDSMINTLSTDILEQSLFAYFPQTKFNIYKYGYSSTTLESAITNLNTSQVLSQNPDILVIESFAYNNFGNSESGLEKQSQLLTDAIKKVHDISPKTKIFLAATIAPNSVIYGNGIANLHLTALDKIERAKTVKLYLENAIKYAHKYNLPLINAYDDSLINDNGFLPLINSQDHLHPSDFGQKFFSDKVAKTLFDNQPL